MNIETPEAMLCATSFILGKFHAGIVMALQEEQASDTISKVIEIEAALRKDIERLYYPIRDPLATA